MEVHVSSLKAEINKYNRLTEEYNTCMLNLYNTLGQTSSYWKDTNSGAFIDEVWLQKNQATKEKLSWLALYTSIPCRYQGSFVAMPNLRGCAWIIRTPCSSAHA